MWAEGTARPQAHLTLTHTNTIIKKTRVELGEKRTVLSEMDQFQSPERPYLCQAPWTLPQSPVYPSFSYEEKQSVSTFDGTQGPLSPLTSKGQTLSFSSSLTADLLCDLRRFKEPL